MKVSRQMKVLAVLALGFAAPAMAEEVSAVKSAPALDKLIKPDSANVQYRYYYDQQRQKDELTKEPILHQLRTNLTFSLFNDKISSTVILAATKRNDDQKVVSRRPEIWNAVSILNAGPLALSGYAYVHLPFQGSGTEAELGLESVIDQPIVETSAGKLSLFVYGVADVGFTSRSEDAEIINPSVARDRGFSLVDAQGAASDDANLLAGEKDDPNYSADVDALLRYVPTAWQKWTFATGMNVNSVWTTKYKANDDGTRDTVYANDLATATRLKISYKADSNVTFTTDNWFWSEGLYEARVNDTYGASGLPRLRSLTYVSYKFF